MKFTARYTKREEYLEDQEMNPIIHRNVTVSISDDELIVTDPEQNKTVEQIPLNRIDAITLRPMVR